MGKPYSLDLRERVVAAIEGGMSTRQAAARFAIGIATAGTWARLKRATGDVRPAKQGKPKGSVLDAHADFILGLLAQAPDTTLDEMVERLQEERDVTIVRTAVWKFLDRHNRTHKKRPHMPASKNAPRTPSIRGETLNDMGGGYMNDFFAREFWRFVLVQQAVAKLAQTAINYPPMQAPASFNLEAVKRQVDELLKEHEGQ
jgi:transposase